MVSYTPKDIRNFGPDSVFVASNARASSSSPVATIYDRIIVCIVYDRVSGKILDLEYNTVLDISTNFIADLLKGKSVYTDTEECLQLVSQHYSSVNQKPIIVALKNAFSAVPEPVSSC